MVELHVYFEELSYQVIEQTPAYEIESLLGELTCLRTRNLDLQETRWMIYIN